MSDLIRGARKRIILVNNYVDDSVLCQLDKRGAMCRLRSTRRQSARLFVWTWNVIMPSMRRLK
jgi:hypothetical protein